MRSFYNIIITEKTELVKTKNNKNIKNSTFFVKMGRKTLGIIKTSPNVQFKEVKRNYFIKRERVTASAPGPIWQDTLKESGSQKRKGRFGNAFFIS